MCIDRCSSDMKKNARDRYTLMIFDCEKVGKVQHIFSQLVETWVTQSV